MSCDNLNGSLTGSVNAIFGVHSLSAEFQNNLNQKVQTVSLNLSTSSPILEGTLSGSLEARFTATVFASTPISTVNTYFLNGTISDPVPLLLCKSPF